MKVVFPEKLDNFYIGRIWIWKTRQKFRNTFADISVQAGFDRVFDQGLTTGVCRLGQGIQ
jgi:hypothetical protein